MRDSNISGRLKTFVSYSEKVWDINRKISSLVRGDGGLSKYIVESALVNVEAKVSRYIQMVSHLIFKRAYPKHYTPLVNFLKDSVEEARSNFRIYSQKIKQDEGGVE